MENASKALIIAGAILLAISIIGIGMYVYQQSAGTTSQIGMDSEKIRSYNEPFEKYEGTRSGSEVKSLCEIVKNHNIANKNDITRNIKILQIGTKAANTITQQLTDPVDPSEINYIKNKIIQANKYYIVDFGYEKDTGYIIAVGIREKD